MTKRTQLQEQYQSIFDQYTDFGQQMSITAFSKQIGIGVSIINRAIEYHMKVLPLLKRFETVRMNCWKAGEYTRIDGELKFIVSSSINKIPDVMFKQLEAYQKKYKVLL
jgi:hypothetical protein